MDTKDSQTSARKAKALEVQRQWRIKNRDYAKQKRREKRAIARGENVAITPPPSVVKRNQTLLPAVYIPPPPKAKDREPWILTHMRELGPKTHCKSNLQP